MKKDVWQIMYTHCITGERLCYMNIGFDTEEDAKREILILKKQSKKYNIGYYTNNRASVIGKNFRIKKIKITPC
jgi:hypothetical protein